MGGVVPQLQEKSTLQTLMRLATDNSIYAEGFVPQEKRTLQTLPRFDSDNSIFAEGFVPQKVKSACVPRKHRLHRIPGPSYAIASVSTCVLRDYQTTPSSAEWI